MNYKANSLNPSLGVTLNFLHKIGFLLITYVVNSVELTPDQWDYLNSIALESIEIAETWEAVATSSPLPWDKHKNIKYGNKTYRQMLEHRVEEMNRLRGLIDYAGPDLIYCCHHLLDTNIRNNIDLLNMVLWIGIVNRFNICLEPYNEISNGRIINELEAQIGWVNTLSSTTKASLSPTIKPPETARDLSNKYLGFIANYYEKLIQSGDKEALRLVKNYELTLKDNREYLLKKRKRKIKPNSVKANIFIPYRSHSWQNGKKIPAGAGGVYRDPDRQ